MAKFTPGPLAGAISGSIGGTTFSRNRYGPYMRRRAMVTTVTSEEAFQAKARMSGISQLWQGLAAADQDAWREWARTNPVTGSLGNSQQLTGHAAFVKLNARGHLMGYAPLDVPPAPAPPVPLVSASLDVDTTATTADLTFAGSPIGTASALFLFACVADSHGIRWVQSLMRYIGISALTQATPFDIWALLLARFGTLYVDQVVHVKVAVISTVTFQVTVPLLVTAVAHAHAPNGGNGNGEDSP